MILIIITNLMYIVVYNFSKLINNEEIKANEQAAVYL
jgi:hypothetical protein